MGINYPSGKKYTSQSNLQPQKKLSNTYSNRGMSLETDINETNLYYLSHNLACIHKKPTPIQIVHVEYPKRSAAVIKEAYFKQASTTDYNGVYKGRYIDFEAKETNNKTSFPLQNVHLHQITHMMQVHKQDGITFVIIRFSKLNEIYFLDASHLFLFWKRYEEGGRKSISREELIEFGESIPISYQARVDYLSVVDRLYF